MRFLSQLLEPIGRAGLSAGLLVAVATLVTGDARADFAYAWGYNGSGQVGNSTANGGIATPIAVSGLGNGVTGIAAGGSFSLAVENGGVYAWGSNFNGWLGDGTTTTHFTPVPLSGNMSNGVTAVAAGVSNSLALRSGGVYAWGNNAFGQLGDGTTNQQSTPEALTGVMSSGVTAVAAGYGYSLALRNGGVYAWGNNANGELGNGSTVSNSTPASVTGLSSGVTAISAGAYHGLAVRNGGVYAWGWNAFGQLGDGVAADRSTPFALTGDLASGVTAIAAGYGHSLAVHNGNVYAWGYDAYGALGDGTTTNSSIPNLTDPADLHNIIAIAAGQDCSYALSSDGSVWDWGDNTGGKLGVGFPPNTTTPQHLLPPNGYVFTSIDVDADGSHAVATLTAVPEPSTFELAAVGLLILLVCARRSRRVAPTSIGLVRGSLSR